MKRRWTILEEVAGSSREKLPDLLVKNRWILPWKVVGHFRVKLFFFIIFYSFSLLEKNPGKVVASSQKKSLDTHVENCWTLSRKVFVSFCGTSLNTSVKSRWSLPLKAVFLNFIYCCMLPFNPVSSSWKISFNFSREGAGPSREKMLNLAVESCWTFRIKVVFIFFLLFSIPFYC